LYTTAGTPIRRASVAASSSLWILLSGYTPPGKAKEQTKMPPVRG
jgi:hypothetical protein